MSDSFVEKSLFPKKPFIIKIHELETPESKAMKYVIYHIGTNVRPMDAVWVEEDELWKVPLKALIPNRVHSGEGDPGKIITFKFENIGFVKVTKTDEGLSIKEATEASEVENNIANKFWKLHSFVEEEIIKAGRDKWGKLSLTRTFLKPLYGFLNYILTNGFEERKEVYSSEKRDFYKLLEEEKLVEVDSQNPEILVPSNLLKGIQQKAQDIVEAVDMAVGYIFTQRYEEIYKKFKIRNLAAYVDLTSRYYVDAIDYGENIKIHEKIIIDKFLKLKRRIYDKDISKLMNAKYLLAEISSVGLLENVGEGFYKGEEKIFNTLMDYREKLLASEMSIHGMEAIR